MPTKTKRKRSAPTTESVENAAATMPSVARLESPVVTLSSNNTVKDAAALKDALMKILDTPGDVAIDANRVERIDTSAMQLLCAFVRDRAERNLGVTWRGVPQTLRDATRLLGVGALLALPADAGVAS